MAVNDLNPKKGISAVVELSPNPGQPGHRFLVAINDDQTVQVGMVVMDAEMKADGLANCKMQQGFGEQFAQLLLQLVSQIKSKSDNRIIVVGR